MIGKRQLQKEQTREKIIAAAVKMYSENGFSVSTAAIAYEAGVSHGSVFVHFPTVESLLIRLLEDFSNDITREIHSLTESGDNFEKLLEMHIDVLMKHETFYKRLVKETVYLPEEAKNVFIAIQSTVSIHFSQALDRRIKEGEIKDIPLHMIFNTWLGLVHYYLLNAELFAPGASVLERYRKDLITHFISLIER
jgi:AcrR family transcriptional regulator